MRDGQDDIGDLASAASARERYPGRRSDSEDLFVRRPGQRTRDWFRKGGCRRRPQARGLERRRLRPQLPEDRLREAAMTRKVRMHNVIQVELPGLGLFLLQELPVREVVHAGNVFPPCHLYS